MKYKVKQKGDKWVIQKTLFGVPFGLVKYSDYGTKDNRVKYFFTESKAKIVKSILESKWNSK